MTSVIAQATSLMSWIASSLHFSVWSLRRWRTSSRIFSSHAACMYKTISITTHMLYFWGDLHDLCNVGIPKPNTMYLCHKFKACFVWLWYIMLAFDRHPLIGSLPFIVRSCWAYFPNPNGFFNLRNKKLCDYFKLLYLLKSHLRALCTETQHYVHVLHLSIGPNCLTMALCVGSGYTYLSSLSEAGKPIF